MSNEPMPQIGGPARTNDVIRALHLQIAVATCDPHANVDLEAVHTALLLMARIIKGEIEWREGRANA